MGGRPPPTTPLILAKLLPNPLFPQWSPLILNPSFTIMHFLGSNKVAGCWGVCVTQHERGTRVELLCASFSVGCLSVHDAKPVGDNTATL